MSWQEQAACRDENPSYWFSDSSALIDAAKRVCAECPVASECLSEAMKRKERYGIWGGFDFGEKERRGKYRRVA